MFAVPELIRTWFWLGYCSHPEEIAERDVRIRDMVGPIVLSASIAIVSILAVWGLAVSPIAGIPGFEDVVEMMVIGIRAVMILTMAIPLLILIKQIIATEVTE